MLTEVLFELHRVGAYMKVSAIDAETGTEVCIVGDPKVGQGHLKRLALRKLEYVMSKQRQGG